MRTHLLPRICWRAVVCASGLWAKASQAMTEDVEAFLSSDPGPGFEARRGRDQPDGAVFMEPDSARPMIESSFDVFTLFALVGPEEDVD